MSQETITHHIERNGKTIPVTMNVLSGEQFQAEQEQRLQQNERWEMLQSRGDFAELISEIFNSEDSAELKRRYLQFCHNKLAKLYQQKHNS